MEHFAKILSNVYIIHKTLRRKTVISVNAIIWYILIFFKNIQVYCVKMY